MTEIPESADVVTAIRDGLTRILPPEDLAQVDLSGLDERTAMVWAQGVRGMIRGLVDWASQRPDYDRFELESQFDVLARALLDGLDRAAPRRVPRAKSSRAASPRPRRAPRRK